MKVERESRRFTHRLLSHNPWPHLLSFSIVPLRHAPTSSPCGAWVAKCCGPVLPSFPRPRDLSPLIVTKYRLISYWDNDILLLRTRICRDSTRAELLPSHPTPLDYSFGNKGPT